MEQKDELAHFRNELTRKLKDKRNFLIESDLAVVIKADFPKAQFHFRVVAKDENRDLTQLTADHLPLLDHMMELANEIIERQTHVESRHFRIGFKVHSSWNHLNLHVVSDDFYSMYMKRERHWNGFNTELFLPLQLAHTLLNLHGSIDPISDEKYSELQLQLPMNSNKFNYRMPPGGPRGPGFRPHGNHMRPHGPKAPWFGPHGDPRVPGPRFPPNTGGAGLLGSRPPTPIIQQGYTPGQQAGPNNLQSPNWRQPNTNQSNSRFRQPNFIPNRNPRPRNFNPNPGQQAYHNPNQQNPQNPNQNNSPNSNHQKTQNSNQQNQQNPRNQLNPKAKKNYNNKKPATASTPRPVTSS